MNCGHAAQVLAARRHSYDCDAARHHSRQPEALLPFLGLTLTRNAKALHQV